MNTYLIKDPIYAEELQRRNRLALITKCPIKFAPYKIIGIPGETEEDARARFESHALNTLGYKIQTPKIERIIYDDPYWNTPE